MFAICPKCEHEIECDSIDVNESRENGLNGFYCVECDLSFDELS